MMTMILLSATACVTTDPRPPIPTSGSTVTGTGLGTCDIGSPIIDAEEEWIVGKGNSRLIIALVGTYQTPTGNAPRGLQQFLFGTRATTYAANFDATIAFPHRDNGTSQVWRWHMEDGRSIYDDFDNLSRYVRCRIAGWQKRRHAAGLKGPGEVYLAGYSNGSGYAGCLSTIDPSVRGTLFLGAPDTFDFCPKKDLSRLRAVFLKTKGDDAIARTAGFRRFAPRLQASLDIVQPGIPTFYEEAADAEEKQKKHAWFRHMRLIQPGSMNQALNFLICGKKTNGKTLVSCRPGGAG